MGNEGTRAPRPLAQLVRGRAAGAPGQHLAREVHRERPEGPGPGLVRAAAVPAALRVRRLRAHVLVPGAARAPAVLHALPRQGARVAVECECQWMLGLLPSVQAKHMERYIARLLLRWPLPCCSQSS